MAKQRYDADLEVQSIKSDLRQQGTRVYRSSRPSKIEPRSDDLIYIADEAERLDFLAFRFYGSSSYWYILASVNDLTDGSVHIPPGMKIRIPSKNRVI